MRNIRVNRAWNTLTIFRTEIQNKIEIKLLITNRYLEYYRVDMKKPLKSLLKQSGWKEMKNGKAASPGRVNIKLVKSAPNVVLEILADISSKYLREQWRHAVISSRFQNVEESTAKTIEK